MQYSENSTVTIEKLESYRTLVTTTTSDLEDHLLRIDEKLETIISRNTAASSHDTPELLSFKEERLSTQKCLLICRQLSAHIHQVQANAPADVGSFLERITHEGLQECQTQLRTTAVLKAATYAEDLPTSFETMDPLGTMHSEDSGRTSGSNAGARLTGSNKNASVSWATIASGPARRTPSPVNLGQARQTALTLTKSRTPKAAPEDIRILAGLSESGRAEARKRDTFAVREAICKRLGITLIDIPEVHHIPTGLAIKPRNKEV